MITQATAVGVAPTERYQRKFLDFTFPEYLTEPAARQAIQEWKAYVASLPAGEKLCLVYNCLAMSGFDSEARKLWQATMAEMRDRTETIWLVSTNMLIITAAKTMSLLSRYTIKPVRSIAEIK